MATAERTVESVKAEIRELSGLDPSHYGGEWMLANPGDFMALCRRDHALGDIVGELLVWLDVYAEPANAR